MFDQSLLAPPKHGAFPLRFASSVLLQSLAAAGLVLVSLATTPQLPMRQLRSLLLVPRAPAQTVPNQAREREVRTGHPVFRAFSFPLHVRATERALRSEPAPPAAAPDLSGDGSSGADGAGNDTGSIFDTNVPLAAEPPPAVVPKVRTGPVAIGGAVAEANLVTKVMPPYPPLAKAAHVQGTVVFHAIIGRDGRIGQLQVISGHPLLLQAARQAVLEWRYRPTLLNGVPVEVATEITVRFSLGAN